MHTIKRLLLQPQGRITRRFCSSNIHFGATNNVPESIRALIGRNLHRQNGHPLCTIKDTIHTFFKDDKKDFKLYDALSPHVSVKQNFDDLLTPPDHVSRSRSDTFYIDEASVLRCHTSAHQCQLIREGERYFLVAGDVYRRDTVDATHYPVFHQMEGVRIFDPEDVSDGILLAGFRL